MRLHLALPLLLNLAFIGPYAQPAGSSAPPVSTVPDSAKTNAPGVASAPVVENPPADTAGVPSGPKALSIQAPGLSRLDLGGTVQLKAQYHNVSADRDADKSLSLQLRRFRLDLDGGLGGHFGFRGEFRMDGNEGTFGTDNAYLYYTVNDLVGFKGGKFKRPFSQEALQSSKSLYTIERGGLYHDFLASTTGYASFDLGIAAYGGFEEDGRSMGYELGVFNGKQNDDPFENYSGQQEEASDAGFKAKDFVIRVTATPFRYLKLEASASTKAAEDRTDPDDFEYGANNAYQAGAEFFYKRLRLMGEAAWGDNHNRLDAEIISGEKLFFAFYAMGVWREDYSRGRASELVLKMEGLDPDFEPGKGEGTPNDGLLRYTFGSNYFFTPRVSIMANYGVLQPVTKVSGEKDLVHDVDLLWRMSF